MITEYDVGPGAYGVAIAADGAVWTSLVERGELACVSPGGPVSRVRLGSAHSRPMVLAVGPDAAVWSSRGDGQIGRVGPGDAVSSVPVLTPEGSPYGLCAGLDQELWYTLIAADRIGRITPGGPVEEFPVATGSMPSLITAGPDGAVWFTEIGAGQVGRIFPDGRIEEFPLPTLPAARTRSSPRPTAAAG